MVKPIFSLPVPVQTQTTKQHLDAEVNRVIGALYDSTIAAASDPAIAQAVADSVAASAAAAGGSATAAAQSAAGAEDIVNNATASISDVTGRYVAATANGVTNYSFEDGADKVEGYPQGWLTDTTGVWRGRWSAEYANPDSAGSLGFGQWSDAELPSSGSLRFTKRFAVTGGADFSASCYAWIRTAVTPPNLNHSPAQHWLGEDDAYMAVRQFDAAGALIATSYGLTATEVMFGTKGAGVAINGEGAVIAVDVVLDADAATVLLDVVTADGDDSVQTLGSRIGNAQAVIDDLTVFSNRAYQDVTNQTVMPDAVGDYPTRTAAQAALVPASRTTITVMHYGVRCEYRRAVSGESVALTTQGGVNWTPAGPIACFEHWGATNDNTGDNSAAIAAALASGMSLVNPRFSRYRATNAVTVTDANISCVGGQVVFTRSSVGDGLVLVRTSTQQITPGFPEYRHKFMNFDIYTTNGNTRSAIRSRFTPALTTKEQLGADRHYTHLEMQSCMMGPMDFDDPTQFFSAANVHLTDTQNFKFHSVTLNGPKAAVGDYVAGTFGLLIDGVASPVRMSLIDCEMKSLETCVRVTGDLEGLTVSGGNYIQCNMGFNFIPPSDGYENLGFWFRGVHMNAYASCIRHNGGAEIYIENCEFYSKDGDVNWAGVDLGPAGAVRDFKITNCTFSGRTGTGTAAAVRLGDANRGYITDNFAVNCDVGVNATALTVKKEIFVRDNNWDGLVDPTDGAVSLAAQTNKNNFLYPAWSY